MDQFGSSVSISGDTAVVGAWLGDDNGDDSGSVYVFERVLARYPRAGLIRASRE